MTLNSYTIPAVSGQTHVRIGAGCLTGLADQLEVLGPVQSILIVADSNVGPLYGDGLQRLLTANGIRVETFTMAAGEASKSLEMAAQAYDALAQARVGRDGLIVALGGGVVGDVAGFVAGTWMRGLRWCYCPTTMEADVDAAVGGKTALNTAHGKNLVGVFHQPSMVVIDPSCLRTLPPRDVRAGLAESIKHALLESEPSLTWHETHSEALQALESGLITELIERNVRFKAAIIEADPYETTGRRTLLNFGHTLGHAIESSADGALRHGECVSLGMVAGCRISQRAGLLGGGDVDRISRVLEQFGLPTRLPISIERGAVMQALELDKKAAQGRIRLVLLEGFGRPVVRDDVPPVWVADAFDSLISP